MTGRLSRIQAVVVGLVALGAVVAIVGTLSKPTPPAEQATASPIADASASPSSFNASPSPTATEPVITPKPVPQTPGVLASIHCEQGGFSPVVSNGRIYAICGDDIVVVDLTTDKVVRTYKSVYGDRVAPIGSWDDNVEDVRNLIVDHGLWIDDSWAGTTWRVDLESGHVAKKITGRLAGHWGGYVWLNTGSQKPLQAVDPASGALGPKLNVPQDVTYACGSLWSWDYPSTLNRFGLDGSLLWSATQRDSIGYMVQLGAECWRVDGWTTFLIRLGESCVTERVPYLGGRITILGDTFWLDPNNTDPSSGLLFTGEYQRIDPSTWTTRGPVWTLPPNTDPFVASDQFWIWNWGADTLQRLDIPLDPWPYTPAPDLPCPAATASPSAAPASPTDTPTAS